MCHGLPGGFYRSRLCIWGPDVKGEALKEFQKGQFARRAMELGGFPVSTGVEHGTPPCHIMERDMAEHSAPAPPALWLSKLRLIQAMRKIDPEMAQMIESLAPVYLVKK